MKPQRKKEHELSAKIKYYRDISGYSNEQLAEMTGISSATLARRYNKPEEFTIREIVCLSKLFKTADFIFIVVKMLGKEGTEYLKKMSLTA